MQEKKTKAKSDLRALLTEAADLRRAGLSDRAEAAYRDILRIAPKNPQALHLLGVLHYENGGHQEGTRSVLKAVTVAPDYGDAWITLGNMHWDAGKKTEAFKAYQQGVHCHAIYPSALARLAANAIDQNQLGNAKHYALLLAEVDPNYENRGVAFSVAQALILAKKFDDAAEVLIAPVRRLHGPGQTPDPLDNTFATTTPVKLIHSIEQFEHLRAHGILPTSYNAVIDNYRAVLEQLPPHSGSELHLLTPAERTRLGGSYNRLIHLKRTAPINGEIFGNDLHFETIDSSLTQNPDHPVIVDNFLSPEALSELRSFCLESTIWWQLSFADELGTSIRNGFATPLLLQIAEEIRERFPRAFGPHLPRIIWAYLYYGEKSGLDLHVDDGAMSVNLWLTPDVANRTPDAGGLKFYDRAAPGQYFATTNQSEKLDILRHILTDPSVEESAVPYRANRAVLFRSNMIHKTDQFEFADGYENRRLNITFLFGNRKDDNR